MRERACVGGDYAHVRYGLRGKARFVDSGFPRAGVVRNLTYGGFTVKSRAPPRCPAPLDSGFRRNDGGYAQYPCAGTTMAERGWRTG